MINPATLKLLRTFSRNNNRTWFEKKKELYKDHKREFEVLIDDLSFGVAQFDPRVQDSLMSERRITKSFRVYRDVRFSKDKTPYKINMSGFVAADVTDHASPVYYLSIQPGGKSFVGGGLWYPEAALLKNIRTYIDLYPGELKKLESDRGFREVFPQGIDREHAVKTSPRGYDKDHEAIEYLRLKSFTAGLSLSDKDLIAPDAQSKVISIFKALYKLNEFIRKAAH